MVFRMDAERLKRTEEIYHAALEISPAERESFLDEVCGEDEDVRREIESLLAVNKTLNNIFDTPPESFAAEMFAERAKQASLVGKEIGHYKIKKLLGRGGMGEVYLAEDKNLNRQVALKFLSIPIFDDKNLLRRFKREAFAASALNHPNILTIYEFNVESEISYLAAEYIKGETLRETLSRVELTLREILDISEQTAFALSAAHKAGIVHRDIKPENIMLREDGIVKILDFGLAKFIKTHELIEDLKVQAPKSTLTQPGTIMGTAAYMSPEQVRGRRDIDGRADIWSLGVVIFEMLTGRVPFAGDTVSDLIASILTTDAPHLSELVGDCPPELKRIVEKALAKNIEERYQAIHDFALDLKSFRRSLELEAELKRSNAANLIPQEISRETKVSNRDSLEKPTKVFIKDSDTGISSEENEIPKSSKHPIFLVAGLLVLLAILGIAGFTYWKNSTAVVSNSNVAENSNSQNVPALSEREISYYLDVQKMRNGKPYEEPFRASGREIFESGYKFRMVLESDTDGFLYIFNEGKNEKGKTEYYLLQPTSPDKDSARIKAKQKIETPYNIFGGGKGTEIVWVIWIKNENEFIEGAKKAAIEENAGGVVNENNSLRLNEFLLQHNKDDKKIDKESSKEVTTVKANGDFIIHRLELEHK